MPAEEANTQEYITGDPLHIIHYLVCVDDTCQIGRITMTTINKYVWPNTRARLEGLPVTINIRLII